MNRNRLIIIIFTFWVCSCPISMAQDMSLEPFVIGADVSFMDQLEVAGAVYKVNGVPADVLHILKDHGVNTARLRLWHSPENGWNSLERTLPIAQRIDDLGLDLLLDIHFSDTWADPGNQQKPAAWNTLSFEALTDSVRAYTRFVMQSFKDQGIVPAYVQVGNEISVGMLWDEGRVGGDFDTPAQWKRLAILLNAAIDSVKGVFSDRTTPAIILHTDHGGNAAAASWFFSHIQDENIPYDIIGLSFYPFWHGSLEDLNMTLNSVSSQFDKPVLLVETAYPWTLGWFDNVNNIVGLPEHVLPGYDAEPNGQYAFLKDVIEIVRNVPSSKGIGLVYWAPEYISVPGVGSSWENMTLFDETGEALKSLDALKEQAFPVNLETSNRATSHLTFFPSPFANDLYFTIERSEPVDAIIRIYNLLGREVAKYTSTIPPGKLTVALNLPELPAGLYVYRGYLGNDLVSGTIVKEY